MVKRIGIFLLAATVWMVLDYDRINGWIVG